jgi:hypothetical protein
MVLSAVSRAERKGEKRGEFMAGVEKLNAAAFAAGFPAETLAMYICPLALISAC